jgi:hypothetical protein
MSDAVLAPTAPKLSADALLRGAGVLWFIPAAVGQWIFAYYIAVQYGASAFSGNLPAWNEIMHNGLIVGDLVGNIALMIHIAIAFVITIGGTLQLIPLIRNRARAFHRWNGRVYAFVAVLTSVAALWMVWTRDGLGTVVNDIAISIDALLIVAFAWMLWRTARARRIEEHQRWALRTFMVVSGVWFMRVMYGFAIMLVQGPPPGVGNNMDGPTDIFVAFGSYLLPLALLEIYFWGKAGGVLAKVTATGVTLIAAGATAFGVFGAILVFWLPRLTS